MNNENMIQNKLNPLVAQHPDYQKEIANIIQSNLTPESMKERIEAYHEKDIADTLPFLTLDERHKLVSLFNAAELAQIFEHSEEDDLDCFISELSLRRQIDVLSELEVTTALDYLKRLEKSERATLIELMDKEVREELQLLGSFDEDEIGAHISTNYISVEMGCSVRQAMRILVEEASEHDNISSIYVVNQENVLVGAIDLKDLIIAREHTELSEIIRISYPYVYVDEQVEDCVNQLKDYGEDSIPVLDKENKLCGVLTAQGIAQLVDDAMGDDYAKLAGLSAEEDLQEPLLKSIRKRLPWLIILLGLGLVVSSVVGVFEPIMAHLAIIVSFQSLILDMSGNVGTQSLAVTIRVLMDEQISQAQKRALIYKEGRIGLVNGLFLGGMSTLLIGLYLFLLKGQTPLFSFSVALCTGLALLISIILSSLSGTVIPLLFKKLNIDPAVASGPLITTLNDLIAVVSFYGLVWLLLIEVLHF